MDMLELQRAQMATTHGKKISREVDDALDLTTDSESDLIVKMSNSGKVMLDSEVWFAGLTGKLALQESIPDEIADRVIKASEEAQAKAQTIFQQYKDVAEATGNAEVKKIADMACQSAEMLFNTLEKLRWDMLDRQADNDIASGRVSEAFTSVDDLLKSLNS